MGIWILGSLAAGPAEAQSPDDNRALTFEEVRRCLCLEREIGDLRRENDLQMSLRREREAELAVVDRKIEARRDAIDAGDPAAVRALRELVARQQRLRDLLRAGGPEGDEGRIPRLNARVAAYNEECAARPMFKLDIERARKDLVCPES